MQRSSGGLLCFNTWGDRCPTLEVQAAAFTSAVFVDVELLRVLKPSAEGKEVVPGELEEHPVTGEWNLLTKQTELSN